MKNKYFKPTIKEIKLDNSNLLLMNSEWEAGDGKPPWAGGPNKIIKSEKKDKNPFKESPFNNNSFEK